jgi:D-methionine transport system substrate-binding protein
MKASIRSTKSYSRKSRFISLVILLTALVFALTACAGPAATEEAAAADTAAADAANNPIHAVIGGSPVPHGDIVNFVKEKLAPAAGLDIEVVEFTDYVQPNLALADGTLDANFFQHQPYLTDFNAEHKTDLVSIAAVLIEPLGIYSNKITSLDEVADGAVVAIPNDNTNGGRALNLLAASGLITLKEGIGYAATVNDNWCVHSTIRPSLSSMVITRLKVDWCRVKMRWLWKAARTTPTPISL